MLKNVFSNSVFKASVDTKKWLKNAGIRAVKTFAQTLGGFITVDAALSDINWGLAFSVAVVATIYSVLTSVAGIPEVKDGE